MDFVILANSIMGAVNSVMSFMQGIVNEIQSAMKFIVSLSYFGQIIMMVVIIGRCIFAAFQFVIEFCIWIFDFLKWLILPHDVLCAMTFLQLLTYNLSYVSSFSIGGYSISRRMS